MIKKIYSYNVNGIRAAINKGFIDWLQEEKPDVICIQETKALQEQVEVELLEEAGYHHYWHSAVKKGYSGVAIFTKEKPDQIIYGMGNDRYDSEGRVLRADFGDVTLLSTYIPSGTTGGPRQDFKMEFLADFKNYVDELKKERPNLIIAGDYNICHKEIDINKPKNKHKTSGFLPEERQWVTEFIESGFIDSFRKFNQDPEEYSWWSYRAGSRGKNLGWRIDYHMVTESLDARLKNARIHQSVVHSDHCPVSIELEF